MSPTTRVVVAGSSPLVRSLLVRSLREGAGLDVTSVPDWPQLRALCLPGHVNVVVAPMQLGTDALIDLIGELLARSVRVLVVCRSASMPLVPDLLFAGASGTLSIEDCTGTQLAAAVQTVTAGGAALNPAVATAVLSQWRDLRSGTSISPAPPLTLREHDVLVEMVKGSATKTIGKTLEMSPKTVESHRSRIYAKLGARNHAHAVRIALESELVRDRH